jgi:hypothetical protein
VWLIRPACAKIKMWTATKRAVQRVVWLWGLKADLAPGSGSLLGRYGGSSATECAIMRALRWLKKELDSDGSGAPKTHFFRLSFAAGRLYLTIRALPHFSPEPASCGREPG